jgi:hypothetical protein
MRILLLGMLASSHGHCGLGPTKPSSLATAAASSSRGDGYSNNAGHLSTGPRDAGYGEPWHLHKSPPQLRQRRTDRQSPAEGRPFRLRSACPHGTRNLPIYPRYFDWNFSGIGSPYLSQSSGSPEFRNKKMPGMSLSQLASHPTESPNRWSTSAKAAEKADTDAALRKDATRKYIATRLASLEQQLATPVGQQFTPPGNLLLYRALAQPINFAWKLEERTSRQRFNKVIQSLI